MAQPAQPSSQINIELPSDLEATYSNFAIINHLPSEIVIHFARLLPNIPTAEGSCPHCDDAAERQAATPRASGQPDQVLRAVGEVRVPNDAGFEGLNAALGSNINPRRDHDRRPPRFHPSCLTGEVNVYPKTFCRPAYLVTIWMVLGLIASDFGIVSVSRPLS